MKRTIVFFTLAFCVAALVSAQGNNHWGPGFGPGGPPPRGHGPQRQQIPQPESASVSGNLTIAQGMIAVAAGDATYLVRGLDRYIGFIDGFKEGATVTIEGYAMPSPQDKNVKFLQAQKMTLNDKEYDLALQHARQRRDMPQHRDMPPHQPKMPPRGRL